MLNLASVLSVNDFTEQEMATIRAHMAVNKDLTFENMSEAWREADSGTLCVSYELSSEGGKWWHYSNGTWW